MSRPRSGGQTIWTLAAIGLRRAMRSSVSLQCEGCGRDFSPWPGREGTSKYCSRLCFKTRTPRTETVCGNSICSNPITLAPWQVRQGVKFCSPECGRKGSHYQVKGCLSCGNSFSPQSGSQKYCPSLECAKSAQKKRSRRTYENNRAKIIVRVKQYSQANSERVKKAKLSSYRARDFGEVTCTGCHSIFRAWLPKQKFCSKVCQEQAWQAAGRKTRWCGDTRNLQASRKGAFSVGLNPKTMNTSIERRMQKALQDRGFSFVTHQAIGQICRPDISFPEVKVAVFCDGDYWHRLPQWTIRDKRINRALKRRGWQALRFWGWEINNSVDVCAQKVEESLTKRGWEP